MFFLLATDVCWTGEPDSAFDAITKRSTHPQTLPSGVLDFFLPSHRRPLTGEPVTAFDVN